MLEETEEWIPGPGEVCAAASRWGCLCITWWDAECDKQQCWAPVGCHQCHPCWCMLWGSPTGRADSGGEPACFDCPRVQRGDGGAALLLPLCSRGALWVSACILEMPLSLWPVLALHAEWWCHWMMASLVSSSPQERGWVVAFMLCWTRCV